MCFLLENRFKTNLTKELKSLFPGCLVVHLDPNEIQDDDIFIEVNLWAENDIPM